MEGFSTRDLTATKSDRLNAADIMACPRRIKITGTKKIQSKDCLMEVYYEGGEGKPWKPCKTVINTLSKLWHEHTGNWIGKEALLYFEEKATYGKSEVGGIRLKAVSDLKKYPATVTVYERRGKPMTYIIDLLEPEQIKPWPDSAFAKTLKGWEPNIVSGKITSEQAINRMLSKGVLSDEQKQKIRDIGKGDADVVIDEDDEQFFNGE